MVNFAILGTSHPHLRTMFWPCFGSDKINIKAVYDENEEASTLAHKLGAKHYSSYDQLIDNEKFEAVFISSVTSKHKELVEAVSKAGKHVFCEKPIATNLEDAWSIVEQVKEHQIKFMISFPTRFARPIQRVKQIIDEGKIGQVQAIRATNHGNAYARVGTPEWVVDPALSGGGSVIDHTVHVADLIRWITGREAIRVYAEMDTLFRPDLPVEDGAILNVLWEGGIFSAIDASWSRMSSFPGWGDLTMNIVGSEGMLFVNAYGETVSIYGDELGIFPPWAPYYGTDVYKEILDAFIRWIEEDINIDVPDALDGLRALEIALAGYKSKKEGRPVSL